MKYRKGMKLIIIFMSIIFMGGLALYYLPQIKSIINFEDLKKTLSIYDEEAKYIYFLVCFLQPIILPVPEPVTIMAGSSVLGSFNGAVIGACGSIIGIITMFILSRYISEKVIKRFINNNKIEKFNRYIKRNEIIVILGLFIFPILPDEVICIGSGLSKIDIYKFIIVAFIAKLITSFSLSYSLEIIKIDFNMTGVIVIIGIIAAVIKFFKNKQLKSC